MNIVVVGSGAMECLFGGWLGKIPGNDVLLVNGLAEHVNTLRSQGLKKESDQGEEKIKVKTTFPSQIDFTADLMIIFTKSYATKSSLDAVKNEIKPETIILTLQI